MPKVRSGLDRMVDAGLANRKGSFRRVPLIAMTLVACGPALAFSPPTAPVSLPAHPPLAPNAVLIAASRDNESLLGRVVLEMPGGGRSLWQATGTNECGDRLGIVPDGPPESYEDSLELGPSRAASPTLAALGFSTVPAAASHLHYRIDASRRLLRIVTAEYLQCCADKKTCGLGFVSDLLFGSGTFDLVAGAKTGPANSPVADGAGGFMAAEILEGREASGYLAAGLTLTTGTGDEAVEALALGSAGARLPSLAQPMRVLPLPTVFGAPSTDVHAYEFIEGSRTISENEFIDRYEELTGSRELEAARGRHGTSIAAFSVGAGLIALGAAALAGWAAGDSRVAPPSTLLTLGLGCLTFGSVGLGLGFAAWNGKATDHAITQTDAERYAARYNLALRHLALVSAER